MNINELTAKLKAAALACEQQEPLALVEYHGKMCLRNTGGIVFTVLRDKADPVFSAENENYAHLAEVSSPANILALTEALEAANELNKHLELAIRKAEGCSEALRRQAEAAEKRIAELEARTLTVTLPAACADDEYFIDGVFQPMRYERDVERALLAAGIKLQIEGE